MFHQKRNQDTRLPARYDCKIRIREVMGGVGRREVGGKTLWEQTYVWNSSTDCLMNCTLRC